MERINFFPGRDESSVVLPWDEYYCLMNLDVGVSATTVKGWKHDLFHIDGIKANEKGEIALIQIIGRQYYFPE